MVRIGRFLFGWRNLLFPVCLTALFVLFRPVPFRNNLDADQWWQALALTIAAAGEAIHVVVLGYTNIKRGGRKREINANNLFVGGLYNHARNPLYVGNLMIVLGLVMIHNNPWVYAIALPLAVFSYCCIVASEEVYLRGRFPKRYAAFCRQVPRWFPRLKGLRQSFEGMEFDFNRVLRSGYSALSSWLAGALALLAYKAYLLAPGQQRGARVALYVGLLVLVAAFSGSMTLMKRRERRPPP